MRTATLEEVLLGAFDAKEKPTGGDGQRLWGCGRYMVPDKMMTSESDQESTPARCPFDTSRGSRPAVDTGAKPLSSHARYLNPASRTETWRADKHLLFPDIVGIPQSSSRVAYVLSRAQVIVGLVPWVELSWVGTYLHGSGVRTLPRTITYSASCLMLVTSRPRL